MIRIGLDISQLAHRGGVTIYTKNLAFELDKLPDLEMVYFYSSLRQPFKEKLRNVKSFKLPPSLFEILFNRWRNIPIEKFIGPIDIFHSSDWTQPPTKAKKVTTFHDVVPLKYPQWSHPKIVAVQKRRLKLVEKEIDMVIAVSEATKKDLLEISSIPEDKIKVIYEGVEKYFKPQSLEAVDKFKSKYKLPSNFVLAVGGVGKRKNIDRIRKAAKGYNLVILGEDIQIQREELPLLYTAAGCLAYASLYEGFGLPVLEAMACGCPVVASDIAVLREIGESGVIYTNPQDVEDIRGKIGKVTEDKDFTKKLVDKGLDQAKKFSWEKCAEETDLLYKELTR